MTSGHWLPSLTHQNLWSPLLPLSHIANLTILACSNTRIACLSPNRNCLLISSIYRNRDRWVEQRGPNITGQGIGLALQPGRYTIRLVKEYKWREQPTVQYSYYSKEKGIHGKLRRRIWVSRAYWVISRNDLQIFFFEGATIFSHTVEDS